MPLADWLAIGYLGIFQVALSYVFLTAGVRRLPALETSLLLLVEPALNPVWAWLVHGERPGALAVLGGALILGSTAAKAWVDARVPPAGSGPGQPEGSPPAYRSTRRSVCSLPS